LQREKLRVYALARELNMESKDLLDMCRQAGMDVKNQLSSLDPEQQDAIVLLVKKGSKGAAVSGAPAAVAPLPTDLSNKVRNLAPVRRAPTAQPEIPSAPTAQDLPSPVIPAPSAPQVEPPPGLAPVAAQAAPGSVAELPRQAEPPRVVETVVASPDLAAGGRSPAGKPAQVPPPVAAAGTVVGKVPDVAASKVLSLPAGKVPSLGQARPPEAAPRPTRPDVGSGTAPRPRQPRQIRPNIVGRPGLAQMPQLKKQMLPKKPEEKTQQPVQKPIAPLPAALQGKSNLSPQDLRDAAKLIGVTPIVPPPDIEDDDEQKGKQRPGGVPGRDQRHLKRSERQKQRKERAEADIRSGKIVALADDDDQPRKSRPEKLIKKMKQPGTRPRVGNVPIEMPITVRTLSAAVGKPVGDLLFRLRDQGGAATLNINSVVDPDVAEIIAHDVGCTLDIKKPLDAEEQLLADVSRPDQPEDLAPRPPIVTIMGHVDHGKTTLLDKIRNSNVAAEEAGGITQVIRAWRVEHKGKWITFLDTPGHEAFTKMRARGANVTDIAVIVVAADDGVMPQTEEAVSHAKAAGVSMVVAINKVDLPNANLNKTRQQLYNLGLLPDNMGGDTPFVETSAAKGTGIDELLENILLVAELKELKANADKPARGSCLEAMLSEGEGVFATLLIRDGTLHKGEVIVCGSGYGRVRAMYDDRGKPIGEAGPSTPVRITGLDEVPNADDPFIAVPDLAVAREIAEQRRAKRQEAPSQRPAVTLEKLSEAKIPELKVILKADFRGSIEAIKKELEKLAHNEVRVNLLHAAIGGITESDVTLALTSPEDTIIVGFNVVPDDRARALAEERGVQIREYDIIYNLTNEIRQALEGKLKPHEQVVHLGRAVVRKVFKIGRVGTVAGCHVTQGVIERSAKIRLIRQGVVIYPPTDRTASLDSLKRFKDDVRDVREGFECGLKVAGYDDLKVDDVIEAYRVEQVQRTLDQGEKK
jgi:translation initiation factor IF-2